MNTALILFAWNLGLLFPIALAAWCLCRIPFLGRRPGLRQGIWLLVLLKFLTLPWIPIPLLPALASPGDHEPAAAVLPSELPGSTKERNSGTDEILQQAPGVSPLQEQASSVVEQPIDRSAEQGSFVTMGPWQGFLYCLLLCSGLVTLGFWGLGWRQLKRIRRLVRGSFDLSDRCSLLLEQVARRFHLKTPPKVCLIASEISPMLWAGPDGPVVLLSRTLTDNLDTEQLQLVLAHELAHYLRRDHWVNLFAFFVTTLFWWHPMAWLARHELLQAVESGCDALVLERFAGSRKCYAQTLLSVLDFIGSQPLPTLGWVSHFGGTSPLGRRIALIAAGTAHPRLSRSGAGLLFVLALSFCLMPSRAMNSQVSPSAVAEPAMASGDRTDPGVSSAFLVKGSVIEKDSRRPVPDALLRFFVDGETDEKKRNLEASTNAAGQFQLEVPVGTVSMADLIKPGYWLQPDQTRVVFTTSIEQPVATLLIEAERGVTWPIQIKTDGRIVESTSLFAMLNEEKDDIRRAKILNGEVEGSSAPPSPSTYTSFDREGKGFLTQCGTSGKFYLAVGDLISMSPPAQILAPIATELIVEPSFDPAKVKTVTSIAGTDRVELVDESGKKARIGKATVDLDGGQARLTFHLKHIEKKKKDAIDHQDFLGQVVNSSGQPIPGVEVQGNLQGELSGGQIPGTVKTDQSGRYRFRLQVIFASRVVKGSLSFLFKKEGYVSSNSRAIALTKTPAHEIDVATHVLRPGHPLSFQVVDGHDKPITGALVYISGDRIAEWLTLRTDAAGWCFQRDLPPGVAQIHVTHGKLHADFPVVISPNAAENTELKFRFHPPPLPEPSTKLPTPLEIGKQAPEWVISDWSDGKKRTLADFRGKWIVLNFWSMAWNPSIRRIPFCQGVADQAQLADVVFLSMHTPGGDPVQIRRLQKLTGWKVPCAIDRGTTLFDGETAKRYGARNPGTFIIDPEGKIAYNDVYKELTQVQVADQERELKDLAASMNLPWPLPHRDDEASQTLEDRFFSAKFGREIEKMMKAK